MDDRVVYLADTSHQCGYIYQPFKVASAVKEQAGKGRGKTSAKMPLKHFVKAPASNIKQHDEYDMSSIPHCANGLTPHR